MVNKIIMWCLVIVYFVKAGNTEKNKVIDIHVKPKFCAAAETNYTFVSGDHVTIRVHSHHYINSTKWQIPDSEMKDPHFPTIQTTQKGTPKGVDYNYTMSFTEIVNETHKGTWKFQFIMFKQANKIPLYSRYENSSVQCSCLTIVTIHELTREGWEKNMNWVKIIAPMVIIVFIAQTAYIIYIRSGRSQAQATGRRRGCTLSITRVPSNRSNCYDEEPSRKRKAEASVDRPLPTLPATSTDNLMPATPIAQRSRMPTPPISAIDIMERTRRREPFERYRPKKPPRTPIPVAPPQPPPRESKRLEPSCKVIKKPRIPSPPLSPKKILLKKLPEIPEDIRIYRRENVSVNHYLPMG